MHQSPSDDSTGSETAKIRLVRLDTLDPTFAFAFQPYKPSFLSILAHSFNPYYGDDYHLKRIVDGRSILYVALIGGEMVGASYVKRNGRRGATAVYPDSYRRLGIAEALVTASLADFPTQYSIVGVSNAGMARLLHKLGFRRAASADDVRHITGDEFTHLSDFGSDPNGVVFKRRSARRGVKRETLILLFRSSDASR